jgi:hypothetical protein
LILFGTAGKYAYGFDILTLYDHIDHLLMN